jgi:glycosyltransferase involved in cell wall biosynthesis
MGTLTIIIPAYNEEESLRVFLPEVVAFCRDRGYKLIVVNDASADGTRKFLDSIEPADFFTVIHHKVNRGYGGAIKSAVRAATTDTIITIDADGQHSPEDVARLHERIVAEDADMVVGNRDGNRQSAYRRAGKNLIRWIARLLLPLHIRDLNSGMKIYDTALAKKYIRFCPDSMAYSDTITLVFIAHKHLVTEERISIRPRRTGTSTITSRTALTTVMELLNIVVLFHPMRIFLPLSILFTVFGIVWNVPIFLRGEGVSVGAMLLIVSGLLFFLLGLITEMLSNMRRDRVDP